MSRRVELLIASTAAAVLFGVGVAAIPSPLTVTVFWVGNFSAPWAVLAFIAGWGQESVWAAALAGALADVACVVGFYSGFLTLDRVRLGLPRSASELTVAWTSGSQWVVFAAPWLLLAVAGGAAYGLFGAWWSRSRSVLAGCAVAAPFFVEPWLWPLYNGYYKGPLVVWLAEVGVGLVVLGCVMAAWRRAEHRLVASS